MKMKQFNRQFFLLASTIYLGCVGNINFAQAQITSDGTVPTNVNKSGNVFEITGGGQAGANLFHSFQEFSLPTGNTAFFNNAASIANIISRVTGGSISNIDGLIKANGGANFILINPKGIYFGPNAQLDIGGSFLGSTADSITFADGTSFSATNPQNPLLTVSVPVGLQMGQNSGTIRVQGTGHNLIVEDPVFSPVIRGDNSIGLSVKAGNTLALVGGNINLEGGVLTAEGGRIELGSVTEGLVSLESLPQGWKLDYNEANNFQDIELRSSSLADASGIRGGSIQVQGKNLSVQDGSLILIQNQGSQRAGMIRLNASESISVSGTNADGTIRTSVNNQTLGTGPGGNMEIFTEQLVVDGGASIVATTFGSGPGGDINVNASESVEMLGVSPLSPRAVSSISSATLSSGNAGDTTVSTKRLTATGGGIIASSTLGTGNGGNLNVTATEFIDIVGVEPSLFTPSTLTVASLNAGKAGNLTVNTSRLTISDGGRVDASALATGDSGSLTINASEFVEVKGTVPQSLNPSLISSAANEVDESFQQAFNLPPLPSGNAGNVTINTPQLKIDNGAQVTVRNDGSGDAGALEINANNIFLNNQGGISAVTREGRGGNINLQIQDSLQMKGASQISSDNLGTGTSGNINITARSVSLLDGSSLTTDSQEIGDAGNINITASEDVVFANESKATSQIQEEAVGNAGNININARSLSILDSSELTTDSRGEGNAGNINITATEDAIFANEISVESRVRGGVGNAGEINITAGSVVVTNDSELESDNRDGVGNAGVINIAAQSVLVNNGSDLRVSTESQGNAGNININASETVTFDNNGDAESRVRPGGVGNGGNVNITTGSLLVTNGGNIRTSSFGEGNAGDINITASDEVSFDGSGINSDGELTLSGAVSSVDSEAVGNAGNVNIKTSSLSITNGAELSVLAAGQGDAGSLRVNANSIFLNNEGSIIATTRSGQGGTIDLQAQNSLQMSGFSQISSDNFLSGDSGDLSITTGKLSIGDGAFISASTFGAGKGANVAIRATESVEITGTGFEEFQETFQAGALSGTLQPDARGTGIFLGTSGTGASGNLTMETPTLGLNDGAVIFSPTFTGGIGGNITIDASESVQIIGSAVQAGTTPGSTGAGGKIEIGTGKLVLRDGGTIVNPTFGDGAGGNVEINALESVELRNTPPGALLLTGIYTNTAVGSGAGGDIRIDTAKLSIRDGVISSATGASVPTGIIPFGGPGGNVIVNASESIEVAGIQADSRFPSGLGTTGFSQSPSGDVTISTKKLVVSEGADISTAALGGGLGGTLTINASESIELIGTSVGDLTLGGLSAASGRANFPELEATGASGDIRVTTKDLVVRDGASIDVQSLGPGDAGNLEVVADSILLDNRGTISANSLGISNTGNLSITARSIVLDNEASIVSESGGGISDILTQVGTGSDVGGIPPDAQIPGTFSPQIGGNTRGGDVNISTQQLVIRGGANISTATFTNTTGGNLTVDASESVQVIGVSPANPGLPSLMGASTFGPGDSGDVTVSTGRLAILDGGRMGAGTLRTGKGGTLTLNATESVEVIGVQPDTLTPSGVAATTFNTGEAGSVTINTARLAVREGGFISASTLGSGSGGSVTINASESVEVSGTVPGTLNPSLVSAGANIEDGIAQQILGRPPRSSGASGDVTIKTGRISITDGAQVTVRNEGSGDAGNLEVVADSIFLNNQATISANSGGIGSTGNVSISARSILLDNGASITAELGGGIPALFNQDSTGTNVGGPPPEGQIPGTFSQQTGGNARGGDINISTQQLVIQGGAGISAATFTGRTGGNITVDASESVQVIGFSTADPSSLSFISTSTFGPADSGDVTLSTGLLSILEGGRIGAGTFGTGSGGDIIVNATESVEVLGAEPSQLAGSLLGASTLNAGDGGNLTINTANLVVRDGGRVDTSTAATGSAGDLTINASESVEISGTVPGSLNPSLVSAGANIENEIVRQIFGLPPLPSGESGDLTINTGRLTVKDGAQVTVRNDGSGNAGNLEVVADSILLDNRGNISANSGGIGTTGNLSLTARSIVVDNEASITAELGGGIPAIFNQGGTETDVGGPPPEEFQIPGTFPPQTRGQTKGGDINISTQQLVIRGGANISTATFTNTTGSNLNVDASDSVQVIGVSPTNPAVSSLIGSSTFGSGDSGDVIVSTGRLAILDGGIFNAGTFASGNGGDITLNVTELVELSNNRPVPNNSPTGLLSNSFGLGNAGNLTINTKKLSVEEGSLISVGTLRQGKGGNITINASDSINISGISGLFPSSIIANTLGEGDGGDIKITTDNLSISNGSSISASSERPVSFPETITIPGTGGFTVPAFATGNAGNVEIKANSINLESGTISAATVAGEGGNINLEVNSLLMRRSSDISATAGGSGNGGNILITGSSPADFVVLLEGSEISANAFEGRGGNIQIDTKGLFVCGDCRISASSELGVEGLVTINRLQPNTELQVIDVPQKVAESEEVVALACATTEGEERSEFIITGRGGLPPRPTEPLSSENLVSFDSSSSLATPPVSQNLTEETDTTKLPAPARGWYVNSEGVLILAAQTPSALPYSSGLTTPKCHDN